MLILFLIWINSFLYVFLIVIIISFFFESMEFNSICEDVPIEASLLVDKDLLPNKWLYTQEKNAYAVNGEIFFLKEDNSNDYFSFEVVSDSESLAEDKGPDATPSMSVQKTRFGLLINSSILLDTDHWNTITHHDGYSWCCVCNDILEVSTSHVENEEHIQNMEKYPPLDRFDLNIVRLINDYYHCGVCNDSFDIESENKHFNSKDHEIQQLSAINKTSDVLYNFDIHSEKIPESYYFNAGSESYIDDETNYTDNVESVSCDTDYTEGYMDLNENDVFYDVDVACKQPISGVSYASVAASVPNQLIINWFGKKYRIKYDSWNMVIVVKMEYYCMACKKYGEIAQKSVHCIDKTHIERLQQCQPVIQFKDYVIRKVDDKFYHCGNCNNLQLTHLISDHIERVHNLQVKSIANKTEERSTISMTISSIKNMDKDGKIKDMTDRKSSDDVNTESAINIDSYVNDVIQNLSLPVNDNFGSFNITLPVTDNFENGNMTLPVTDNFGNGNITLPVKDNSGSGNITLPVNVNSGNGYITLPVKDNSGSGNIMLPVKAISESGSITLPVKAISASGSITLPVKDNSGSENLTLPVNVYSGNGNITLPVNDNSGNSNKTLPVNDNSGNGNITLPVKDNSGNGDITLPVNDNSGNGNITLPDNNTGNGNITLPVKDNSGNGNITLPVNDNSGSSNNLNENIVPNDLQKFIIIHQFGFNIRVTLLSYNLVWKHFCKYYCGACNVLMDETFVNWHLESKGHTQTLNQIHFIPAFGINLMRAVCLRHARKSHQEMVVGVHCTICNRPMIHDKWMINAHILDYRHLTLLNMSLGLSLPNQFPPFPPIVSNTEAKKEESSKISIEENVAIQNLNRDSVKSQNLRSQTGNADLNQEKQNKTKIGLMEDLDNHTKVGLNQEKVDKQTEVGLNQEKVDNQTKVGLIKEKVDNQTKVDLNKEKVDNQTKVGLIKEKVNNQTKVGLIKEKVDNQTRVGLNPEKVDNQTKVGLHQEKVDSQTKVGLNKEKVDSQTKIGLNKEKVDNQTKVGLIKEKVDNQTKVGLHQENVDNQTKVVLQKVKVDSQIKDLHEEKIHNQTKVHQAKIDNQTKVCSHKQKVEKETTVGLLQEIVDNQTVGLNRDEVINRTVSTQNNVDIFSNLEELIFVKLKNNFIKITLGSFNAMVHIGNGGRYCFLCSLTVLALNEHLESGFHLENMKECRFIDKFDKNLIRQKSQMYHCSICNIMIFKKDIQKHLSWLIHVKSDSLKNAKRHPDSSHTKTFKISLAKEVHMNRKDELKVMTVLANYSFDTDNTVDSVAKKNKIIIHNGNTLKLTWDAWHGVCKNKNGYHCILCKCDFKNYELNSHVSLGKHLHRLESFEIKYLPALIRKVDDMTLNCVTCNSEVLMKEHIILDHIKGKKHLKHHEDTRQSSATANTDIGCNDDVFTI